jgi:hypothetical protein
VLVAALAFVAALSPAAEARQGDSTRQSAGDGSAAPLGTADRVDVRVERFGLGDDVRPGAWAGIRLQLQEQSGVVTRALAQVHLRDADGDTLLARRDVTLTPGVPRTVWLYVRLPWTLERSSVLLVTVREAEEVAGGALLAGEQLGSARISPTRIEPASFPRFGVVGRPTAGLEQYRLPAPRSGAADAFAPSAGEAHAVISGLVPGDLPDEWLGLDAYEVLLWTEGSPLDLTEGRDRALAEWIRRGGHLVVVLPPAGSQWFSARNPLAEAMPAVEVERVEDADLSPYRWLLTTPTFDDERLPDSAIVQAFVPRANAGASAATEVISGPHGCVVARRVYGTGFVTVIGLPLTSRALASDVLRADAFWHRVLGERFEIVSMRELQDDQQLANRYSRTETRFGVFDRFIASGVSQTRAASVGVLLAIVVFAAYWLLAGPGGFALLKAKRWQHHSWVAFALIATGFSVIAWIGARAISPGRVNAQHVTFLDHVYGQEDQRARTYASIVFPRYGDATVVVGEPGTNEDSTQALSPWSGPESTETLSFPDARTYVYNLDRPDRLTFPVRATSKSLRLDWLGGPRWSMPQPVDRAAEPARSISGGISGRLTHGLPEPLTDVTVIYVDRQRSAQELFDLSNWRTRHRSVGRVWALPTDFEWAAGQELDLSGLDPANASSLDSAFARYVPNITPTTLGNMDASADGWELATFYGALPPPEWRSGLIGARRGPVRRLESHGLDVSRWFTQPCVMIVGRVRGGPTPTPMFERVGAEDLRAIPARGQTIVRWVFPLPSSPVRFDGSATPPGESAEDAG